MDNDDNQEPVEIDQLTNPMQAFVTNTEADIKDAIASIDAAQLIERVTAGNPQRLDWLTALAGLEAKQALGETLTPFEVEYRQALVAVLTEGKQVEQVHVQELLYNKVGAEKYKRVARRFADHQKELEVLQKINAELNAEVETRSRLRGAPVKAPAVIHETFEPGIYLLEAGPGGRVKSSFKITAREDGTFDLPLPARPRSAADIVAELANQEVANRDQVETGFWAGVRRFFANLLTVSR